MVVRSSFRYFVWYLPRRLPFHGVLPISLPCHTHSNYIQKPTYRSCFRCWHCRLWRRNPHLSVVALEDGIPTWNWRRQSFLFAGSELTGVIRYVVFEVSVP